MIDTQLSIAAEVQQALLPAIPPPSGRIEWFGITQPAGKVGGDYFDFLPLADGRMCVALADVSGKGIPAAIFLSNVRAVLHTLIRETSEPRLLAERLSETLAQEANGGLYVSAILAVVDPARGQFTYTEHRPSIRTRPEEREAGPAAGNRGTSGRSDPWNRLRTGNVDARGRRPRGIRLGRDHGKSRYGWSHDRGGAACRVRRINRGEPEPRVSPIARGCRARTGPRGVKDWSDDKTVVAFGGRLAVGCRHEAGCAGDARACADHDDGHRRLLGAGAAEDRRRTAGTTAHRDHPGRRASGASRIAAPHHARHSASPSSSLPAVMVGGSELPSGCSRPSPPPATRWPASARRDCCAAFVSLVTRCRRPGCARPTARSSRQRETQQIRQRRETSSSPAGPAAPRSPSSSVPSIRKNQLPVSSPLAWPPPRT